MKLYTHWREVPYFSLFLVPSNHILLSSSKCFIRDETLRICQNLKYQFIWLWQPSASGQDTGQNPKKKFKVNSYISMIAQLRQEYWSGLPFPPPGGLPDPGIIPVSLANLEYQGILYQLSPRWNTPTPDHDGVSGNGFAYLSRKLESWIKCIKEIFSDIRQNRQTNKTINNPRP